MNIFKSKQPTVQEVDTALADLDQQRAAIRARRGEIEQAMADTYGDQNGGQQALEAEYSTLEGRMASLAIVQQRLQAERAAAAKRAILAALNADIDAALKTYDKLPSLQAKREKAAAAYFDAINAENAARQELRQFVRDFKLDRPIRLGDELKSHGLTLADIAQELDQARARLGDLNDSSLGLVNPATGKLTIPQI